MVLEDSDMEMVVAEIEVSVSRFILECLCRVAFSGFGGLCCLIFFVSWPFGMKFGWKVDLKKREEKKL